MIFSQKPRTSSKMIVLEVGGDRLTDLELEIDGILEQWTTVLSAADGGVHGNTNNTANSDDNDNATGIPSTTADSTMPTTATNEATPAVSNEEGEEQEREDITLKLGGRSYSVVSMSRLAAFVESYVAPRLVNLQAADIIAQQRTQVGYDVIRLLANALRNANKISIVNFADNALGPPSLEQIRVLLNKPSLTSISFANTGVDGDECMRIVKESFLESIRSNINNIASGGDGAGKTLPISGDSRCFLKLRELNVSRNTMGEAGGEHIGAILPLCIYMECLHYSAARPFARGTRAICHGLQQMASNREQYFETTTNDDGDKASSALLPMRVLDFCDSSLNCSESNESLDGLCFALRRMPHLQTLLLQDSGLTMDGLRAVVNALLNIPTAPPLVHINLGDIADGELGKRGGKLLAQLLSRFTATLQVLELEGNDLGWYGLEPILPILAECQSLHTVRLGRNGLGSRAAQLLMKHAPTTTAWHTLNLDGNLMQDDDLQAQLSKHFSETNLVFDDQDDGDEEEDNDQEEYNEEEEDDNAQGGANNDRGDDDDYFDELEHASQQFSQFSLLS